MFEALLAALDSVDQDRASLYADVVLAVLPAAARDYLEAQTTITDPHRYQSDFARRYFASGKAEGEAKGKAEGEAKAIFAVLDARGIDVPDDVRRDVSSCTDLDQLDTWIRRAVTVDKATDLFG